MAITRGNFDTILRENPGIVLTVLKEMAARLKATSAALAAREPPGRAPPGNGGFRESSGPAAERALSKPAGKA